MSIETARAVISRMDSDPAYAAKVMECRDFAALQEFFARQGLDVTPEELIEEMSLLADSDLEQVAGGALIDRKNRSCGQVFQDGFEYVLCKLAPLAK